MKSQNFKIYNDTSSLQNQLCIKSCCKALPICWFFKSNWDDVKKDLDELNCCPCSKCLISPVCNTICEDRIKFSDFMTKRLIRNGGENGGRKKRC
jgi:hypothetical protein